MNSRLYRCHDVWERTSDFEIAIFRCFELLDIGEFCVQSCDHIRIDNPVEQEKDHCRQKIELFLECAPEIRAGECSKTLLCAIDTFKRQFAAFSPHARHQPQADTKSSDVENKTSSKEKP